MEGEGGPFSKGSPSPVSHPSFPNLTSPYAEAIDDELGDLLMLGLARAFDAHGRAEFKVDGLFDIHRAEIFEEVPVPPRIGLERHRNDRNPGALGKLDADGIEMRGSKTELRVLCGKTMTERPCLSLASPPSSTATRSSRGLLRPTTMGSRDPSTGPKKGYFSRLSFTTKVTSFHGWIMEGSTNVSNVLIWLPIKTQGPSSERKCSIPAASMRQPTDSSACAMPSLLWAHASPSY